MLMLFFWTFIFDSISFAATDTNGYDVRRIRTGCNMRETPSQNGNWVMAVPTGTLVVVLEESDSTYTLVQYGEYEGYVYSACLVKDEDITYIDYMDQFPGLGGMCTSLIENAMSALSAEAITSSALDTFSAFNNENLDDEEIVEQDNPLSNISVSRTRVTGLTRIEETETAENIAVTVSSVRGTCMVEARLREAPTTNSTQIGSLFPGDNLVILDSGENGYLHVTCGDKEGYVFARCVNYDASELSDSGSGIVSAVVVDELMNESEEVIQENVQVTLQSRVVVDASSLASQRQAFTDLAAHAMADEITTSSTISESVEIEELVTANHAAPISEQIVEVASETTSSILANRVTMRSLPDNSSNSIISISAGTDLVVLGAAQNGYTLVQYNGLTGYVLSNSLVDSVDITRIGSEPVMFTITAYCPCRICCGSYSPEVRGGVPHTATGTIPEQGRTIAVDPSVIPYGTHVYIDGYGTFTAEDCGGAVLGNHIDMYFDNHEDAILFGTKRVYVSVVQ